MIPDAQRDDVKGALTDPAAVCARLGLDEGAKRQAGGLLIRCPSHAENNPSCSVTLAEGTIRVKCFACGFGGDVFNLVAAVERLDIGSEFPRVLEAAARLAGMNSTPPPARVVPITQATVNAEAIWNALDPIDSECWEYVRGRGLEEAADLCRTATPSSPSPAGALAKDGYVLAMALRNARGKVTAIQVRKIDAHDFRVIGKSTDGLFGDPPTALGADVLVVAEGMTDSLAGSLVTEFGVVGIAGTQATAELYRLPLAGRRVLVATDADKAGDEAGKTIVEALGKLGARAVRCRPTGAKDLADMLAQGQDLGGFFRSTAAKHAPAEFKGFGERIRTERVERLALAKRALKFGIHFLDVALGAILSNDLILIGAMMGAGKTETANIIGLANAGLKKRVHYFALEAEDKEIERRNKWRLISAMAHIELKGDFDALSQLNFLDWQLGRLEHIVGKYEDIADQELTQKYGTFKTLYRTQGDFTINDLERHLIAIADETDLAIVDHVHFLDSEDPNENRGYKQIVKRIRSTALAIGKPVIVVAHIRKGDRKNAALVPTLEDFHGTSDIPKMATKAIMFAPAFDRPHEDPMVWNTYISPAKCRQDGSRARYVGVVPFDARMSTYKKAFELGQVVNRGEKFEELPFIKWPAWAKRKDPA